MEKMKKTEGFGTLKVHANCIFERQMVIKRSYGFNYSARPITGINQ